MIHVKSRGNCFCIEEDCNGEASEKYFVRFGRDICRRFNDSYGDAEQFLFGLRHEKAEGKFDARDYQKHKPLSFKTLKNDWLELKEKQIDASSYRNLKNYMSKAYKAWGDINVRQIDHSKIEKFLFSKTTANNEKTRHNIRSCIHDFFQWVKETAGLIPPKIPKVPYELGTRNYTTRQTQQLILSRIHETEHEKAAFGIELLATYPSLRPDDLRRAEEQSYCDGTLTFHNPTKKKNKFTDVKLIPKHAERWEELQKKYPASPDTYFFRHTASIQGCRKNDRYGKRYLYKCWIRACQHLGIKNLDLYGGTRHTTTTTIAKMAGREKAKKASQHRTNWAFNRYCKAPDNTAFEMAELITYQPETVIEKTRDALLDELIAENKKLRTTIRTLTEERNSTDKKLSKNVVQRRPVLSHGKKQPPSNPTTLTPKIASG